MKIPTSVRIGGTEYKIKEVPYLNDGTRVLLGNISHANTEIKLNLTEVSHEMAGITLWHEMFHAVAERAGLKLGEAEEDIIDAFAYGTYQILQDNGRRFFDIVEPEKTEEERNDDEKT